MPDMPSIIFQQDGASAHRTRKAQYYAVSREAYRLLAEGHITGQQSAISDQKSLVDNLGKGQQAAVGLREDTVSERANVMQSRKGETR